MRVSLLLICCAFIISVFAKPTSAAETKYVKVKSSFANVYEYLDPQSKVIMQAKKGDYLEMVFEGASWYQVKIQEKVGWLEKRAGAVVGAKEMTILSMPVAMFFICVFILIATFAVTSFYIYRHKTAEL
jgi:hypothetical protein